MTKQISNWLCGTNSVGQTMIWEKTQHWALEESQWWFLHRFTYGRIPAATVASLGGNKSAPTVCDASMPAAVRLTDASTVPPYDHSKYSTISFNTPCIPVSIPPYYLVCQEMIYTPWVECSMSTAAYCCDPQSSVQQKLLQWQFIGRS